MKVFVRVWKDTIEAKNDKNYSFKLFCGFWAEIFRTVDGNASAVFLTDVKVFRETFLQGSLYLKVLINFHIFSQLWLKTFRTLCGIFSTKCSKLNSGCPEERFGRTKVLRNSFFTNYFLILRKFFSEFDWMVFRKCSQNCKKNLWKSVFWRFFSTTIYSFRTLSGKFLYFKYKSQTFPQKSFSHVLKAFWYFLGFSLDFGWKFLHYGQKWLSSVLKTAFHVSTGQFWKKLSCKRTLVLYFLLNFERKTFVIRMKMFRQSSWNCNLRVQRNFWNFSCEKFSKHFQNFETEFFWNLGDEVSACFSKLLFKCPEEYVGGKRFREELFFCNFFCNLSKIISDFGSKLFGSVLPAAFYLWRRFGKYFRNGS